ncbi:MAG: hypothetical protein IKO36_01070 [Bacteroidaceae bacterium]|nr:hypothetical protein [Bacteroidaceae bacterium]
MHISKFAAQVNETDRRSYKFYLNEETLRKINGFKDYDKEIHNFVVAEVEDAGDMLYTEMEIEHHDIEGEPISLTYMGILDFDSDKVKLKPIATYNIPSVAPEGMIQVIISNKKFSSNIYEFSDSEKKDLEYFARKSKGKFKFDEMDYEGALTFVCNIAQKIVNPINIQKAKNTD